MTRSEMVERERALDKATRVIGALAIAVAALMIAASATGCAAGLQKVEAALPAVASGVHAAAVVGKISLHEVCTQRAGVCLANGVKDRANCPGWLKCDAVRVALEEATRAIESDITSIAANLEAIRKVQAAIKAMGGK